MTIATYGGRVYSVYISTSQFIRSQDRGQRGQEPECRFWCRGYVGALLIGLFLIACSVCFLNKLRTTSPEITPPTMFWALSPWSLIKNLPYRLAYSQILWKHFLNLGFFLWRLYLVSIWHRTISERPIVFFICKFSSISISSLVQASDLRCTWY